MSEKEYTYQDVAEHNTRKDIFLVIHEKIYDASKFIDEHPGGEEVLLDVAGQDATEAFEDVGHSDEARETLAQLEVGILKRRAGDPEPKAVQPSLAPAAQTQSAGLGTALYGIILVGGLAAFGVYQYMQLRQQHS